jgi:nucleoside 2-deoxyribosyltransferase
MPNKKKCHLCAGPAHVTKEKEIDLIWIDCPNCGEIGLDLDLLHIAGTEGYDLMMHAMIAAERRLLRGDRYIITKDASGFRDDVPYVNSDEFLSNFPKPKDIFNRSLVILSKMAEYPSSKISIDQNAPTLFFGRSTSDIGYVLLHLRSMGYIRWDGQYAQPIEITANGWSKVDEIESIRPIESKQVFVAMWFDKSMDPFYKAIEEAVEVDKRYDCFRVDTKEHNNDICDEIIAEIRRSRFMIADFTGNRGGVYFEAGFAMGIGIPVIWTVYKKWIEEREENKIHFDTEHYNHIFYNDADDLKSKLVNRIRATIT